MTMVAIGRDVKRDGGGAAGATGGKVPVIGRVSGNGVVTLSRAGELALSEFPALVFRSGKWRRQTTAEHRVSRHKNICLKIGACDCRAHFLPARVAERKREMGRWQSVSATGPAVKAAKAK